MNLRRKATILTAKALLATMVIFGGAIAQTAFAAGLTCTSENDTIICSGTIDNCYLGENFSYNICPHTLTQEGYCGAGWPPEWVYFTHIAPNGSCTFSDQVIANIDDGTYWAAVNDYNGVIIYQSEGIEVLNAPPVQDFSVTMAAGLTQSIADLGTEYGPILLVIVGIILGLFGLNFVLKFIFAWLADKVRGQIRKEKVNELIENRDELIKKGRKR